MNPFEIIGWVGNGCYFLRFVVQWLASERAGRSVAPRSFWWYSLAGALCLTTYSLAQNELVLLLGYLVTSLIYIRNLWIHFRAAGTRTVHPVPAMAIAVAAWLALVWFGVHDPAPLTESARWWIVTGIVGQSIWCSRFLVQWWHAEHTGRSEFPLAFWWISLVGNALILLYAIHTRDPVYIAGLAIGPIVQSRNLVLALRKRAQPAEN